ncbi:MAG: AraC family ligand binding domain-containing protein, partial [Clostridia bacterium]|nr:AraC family ligand binding domain-containing protein [Clostridia bacterium]
MKTYLRHKSLNVIDVRELIALEYLDFEGKYKDYVEKHDFCELCYVECGEITLSLAGDRVTLSEGQALLIEPDTEHSYYSEYGNAARVFVICFECAMHTLRSLAGVAFDKDQQRLTHQVPNMPSEADDSKMTIGQIAATICILILLIGIV